MLLKVCLAWLVWGAWLACLPTPGHGRVILESSNVPGAQPKLGPRENETGRFIYTGSSTGQTYYCMFCPLKAVTDSTYDYMQQRLCFAEYEERNWTSVLSPWEQENKKYAICNDVGRPEVQTPGCRAPPDLQSPNSTWYLPNSAWRCVKGYNNEEHSVYTYCQLVCTVSRKVVAQIYCNETLVWHTDFREDIECEVPTTTSTTTTTTTAMTPSPSAPVEPVKIPVPVSGMDTEIYMIIGAVGGTGLIVAIGLIVWCCCRKKLSPSQQPSEEDVPGVVQGHINGITNGIPLRQMVPSTRTTTLGGSASSIGYCSRESLRVGIGGEGNGQETPNRQEEVKDEEEEEEEESNESDKLLDGNHDDDANNVTGNSEKDANNDHNDNDNDNDHRNSKSSTKSDDEMKSGCNDKFADSDKPGLNNSASDKSIEKLKGTETPDVKVFHSNMRDSVQDNQQLDSSRLQENAYSVPQGSTFYIVPSSPGGKGIIRFHVERKNGGTYRGRPCPELGLDFFHTVPDACPEDAGLFTWYITLENGQQYQRDFQIFISSGADNPDNNNTQQESLKTSVQSDGSRSSNATTSAANDDDANNKTFCNNFDDDNASDDDNIETRENLVEFDSGDKKSGRVEGPVTSNMKSGIFRSKRPEPLGAEDEPQVRSTPMNQHPFNIQNQPAQSLRPEQDVSQPSIAPDQIAQSRRDDQHSAKLSATPDQRERWSGEANSCKANEVDISKLFDARVEQAQIQRAVPANMNNNSNNNNDLNRRGVQDSGNVSHLNFNSFSLANNDQQPVVQMREAMEDDDRDVGRGVDRGPVESEWDSHRGLELRGEIASLSFPLSDNSNSNNVVPQPAGRVDNYQANGQGNSVVGQSPIACRPDQPPSAGHLDPLSILYSSGSQAISGAHFASPNNSVGNVLDHVRPPNLGSLNAPSYVREGPSGMSSNVPYVECPQHPRPEMSRHSDGSEDTTVENNVENDAQHQTHRKETDEGPTDQCITRLYEVRDQTYLENLCHMADPRDRYGYRGSWMGFGRHHGIQEHMLRAIEYHRRGFLNEGPMRTVLLELQSRLQVCDIVKYFLDNDRRDIVDLTIDRCPNHRNCAYCIRLRTRRDSS